jgi:hypothetical protein
MIPKESKDLPKLISGLLLYRGTRVGEKSFRHALVDPFQTFKGAQFGPFRSFSRKTAVQRIRNLAR